MSPSLVAAPPSPGSGATRHRNVRPLRVLRDVASDSRSRRPRRAARGARNDEGGWRRTCGGAQIRSCLQIPRFVPSRRVGAPHGFRGPRAAHARCPPAAVISGSQSCCHVATSGARFGLDPPRRPHDFSLQNPVGFRNSVSPLRLGWFATCAFNSSSGTGPKRTGE